MKVFFIDAERTGYDPSQVRDTLTIGELADIFSRMAEDDADVKVYLRHDGGYTYGGINGWNMDFAEVDGESDEEE